MSPSEGQPKRSLMLALLACATGACAGPAVYVAGARAEGPSIVACVWKNGVCSDLPGPGGAQADALFVDRDGCCAAGACHLDSTASACCWVNGRRIALPGDGAHESWARAIAVSAGKVYVAGRYSNGNTTTACLWIDGRRRDLPGPDGSGAESIRIHNGHVYVSGYVNDITTDHSACLWIDGRRQELPGGTLGGSVASSVWVADDRVYAAGSYGNYAFLAPCCWIDGRLVPLPGGGKVNAIEVAHGTIQAAGFFGDESKRWAPTACCWRDGVRATLPGAGESSASALCLAGGKVYAAGSYDDGTRNVACYWTDGIRTDLAGGTRAAAIVVRP